MVDNPVLFQIACYPSQWKRNFAHVIWYRLRHMEKCFLSHSLIIYFFLERKPLNKKIDDNSSDLTKTKKRIKGIRNKDGEITTKMQLQADLAISVCMFPLIFFTRIVLTTAALLFTVLYLPAISITLLDGAMHAIVIQPIKRKFDRFKNAKSRSKPDILLLILFTLIYTPIAVIAYCLALTPLLSLQIFDLMILYIPTIIGELILALPIIGQLLCIAIRYYNGFYTEPDETANISDKQVDGQQPEEDTDDHSFYQLTTLL